MKRMPFILLAILMIAFLLSACGQNVSCVPLTGITLDGVVIGDDFETISTDNYILSDRFPEQENTVNYEEWRITTEEEKISKIDADFADVTVSINSYEECQTVDDVIAILGDSCISWYDKEQKLRKIVYMDNDNLLQATFVYNSSNKQLVRIILERTSQ